MALAACVGATVGDQLRDVRADVSPDSGDGVDVSPGIGNSEAAGDGGNVYEASVSSAMTEKSTLSATFASA